MELRPPLCISPRLLPAVKIGEVFVQLDDITPAGERERAHIIIDGIPGMDEYTDDSMKSGAGGFSSRSEEEDATAREIIGGYLSFLDAAAESYAYRMRTGRTGDNENMFPPAVVEWAHANADEIGMIRMELEEDSE